MELVKGQKLHIYVLSLKAEDHDIANLHSKPPRSGPPPAEQNDQPLCKVAYREEEVKV